jgi:hypothetical protein
LAAGKQTDGEEAANSEFVDDVKFHLISTPVERSRLAPVRFGLTSFNTIDAGSSSTLFGW